MQLKEKKQAQLEKLMSEIPTNPEKRLMDTPGIYYGGGCSYMACRGLMMGPMSDILLITHGPTGCGCYSGLNADRDRGSNGGEAFRGRSFSTNMREVDIIFGGEQKLLDAIGEAVLRLHPKVIAVCATCPVGLIGDDIEQTAKIAEERYGVRVLALSCEGFRSHGQGGWMHGAQRMVECWMGEAEHPVGPYPIHFMSESYNGGQKAVYDDIFGRIGYEVVCSLMGANTYERVRAGQQAKLIVLDSGKSIDPVAKEIQDRFGGGFFRVSFTGISNTVRSLRRMADYFGDDTLIKNTEQVITEELAKIEGRWQECQEKLSNKRAAIFEDIFRSDSFAALSADLGMEVILIAQDYSCDDYTDENFTVHVSERLWHTIEGMSFRVDHRAGGRVWYRLGRSQVRNLLAALRPDLCFAGIEEQFGYNDSPVKSEQFTSDNRGVSYQLFEGILRYARDVQMALYMSHWATEKPHWMAEDKEDGNVLRK